jgi:hypothetical protein
MRVNGVLCFWDKGVIFVPDNIDDGWQYTVVLQQEPVIIDPKRFNLVPYVFEGYAYIKGFYRLDPDIVDDIITSNGGEIIKLNDIPIPPYVRVPSEELPLVLLKYPTIKYVDTKNL